MAKNRLPGSTVLESMAMPVIRASFHSPTSLKRQGSSESNCCRDCFKNPVMVFAIILPRNNPVFKEMVTYEGKLTKKERPEAALCISGPWRSVQALAQILQLAGNRTIKNTVANFDDQSAQNGGINLEADGSTAAKRAQHILLDSILFGGRQGKGAGHFGSGAF